MTEIITHVTGLKFDTEESSTLKAYKTGEFGIAISMIVDNVSKHQIILSEQEAMELRHSLEIDLKEIDDIKKEIARKA